MTIFPPWCKICKVRSGNVSKHINCNCDQSDQNIMSMYFKIGIQKRIPNLLKKTRQKVLKVARWFKLVDEERWLIKKVDSQRKLKLFVLNGEIIAWQLLITVY